MAGGDELSEEFDDTIWIPGTDDYENMIEDRKVYDRMIMEKEKPKPAKPCPKCGGYYPGDCTCGYNCDCDGCNTLREMEKPENHIHNFNSTAGDTEYDNMGDEYLVMECICGETELMATGANYYDELNSEEECVEPTLGYEDDLGV